MSSPTELLPRCRGLQRAIGTAMSRSVLVAAAATRRSSSRTRPRSARARWPTGSGRRCRRRRLHDARGETLRGVAAVLEEAVPRTIGFALGASRSSSCGRRCRRQLPQRAVVMIAGELARLVGKCTAELRVVPARRTSARRRRPPRWPAALRASGERTRRRAGARRQRAAIGLGAGPATPSRQRCATKESRARVAASAQGRERACATARAPSSSAPLRRRRQRAPQPPSRLDAITDLNVELLSGMGRPGDAAAAGRLLPGLERLHGWGFVVDVAAVRQASLPTEGPGATERPGGASALKSSPALRGCVVGPGKPRLELLVAAVACAGSGWCWACQ